MTYLISRNGVIRNSDGAFIPNDPRNADWQEYQKWIDAGNLPGQAPPPTLADLKSTALAALAERRWAAETSGTTIGGIQVKTDAISQAKLISVYVSAKDDPNYSATWKSADGSFILLDATQIIAIGLGVRTYVQACFDREASLAATINSAVDAATLDAIDINVGWPV